MTIKDRFKHAWNAFRNRDPTVYTYQDVGLGSSYQPGRASFSGGNERSIVTAIYNRIAVDVAAIDFKHVKLDGSGRFVSEIQDPLNECLTLQANIDQTARAFKQDVVISMLDEGVVAAMPTITNQSPMAGGEGWKIYEMRTAKIVQWYPRHVRLRLYNDLKGKQEEIVMPKEAVAIIENPFYAVMNEPNSTMQRLVRKLNLLDLLDEQLGSGKLDLIIQLPYVIKTDLRRKQAEDRRKDIENQLSGSKYGIAYTDGTEKITQLNRPVDNNLMNQIEYLTSMLYGQLGFSKTLLDGSADEKTMLNYDTRIIEPVVSAIVDAMKVKFLSRTARTQGQTIMAFRNPFRLVPVSQIAEIADKFTRNEIMTANEIRQVVGLPPSDDPNADVLKNKNISHPEDEEDPIVYPTGEDEGEIQNE
jgi:hypothetical protein